MKYRILRIFDEDYGCEGVPDDEEPMCSVLAEDSSGNEKWFRLSDPFLTAKGLTVGSEFDTDDEGNIIRD